MTTTEQIMAKAIINQAVIDHVNYPQYKDHWNGWVLGTIMKTIKGKCGLYFEKGERVIVKPEIRDVSAVSYAKRKSFLSVTCYSNKTKMNTSVWLSEVEVDSKNFPVLEVK